MNTRQFTYNNIKHFFKGKITKITKKKTKLKEKFNKY